MSTPHQYKIEPRSNFAKLKIPLRKTNERPFIHWSLSMEQFTRIYEKTTVLKAISWEFIWKPEF